MTSQNAEADCCDRAQELTDKIPPCTRQYILQMFTGSYRDSQGNCFVNRELLMQVTCDLQGSNSK